MYRCTVTCRACTARSRASPSQAAWVTRWPPSSVSVCTEHEGTTKRASARAPRGHSATVGGAGEGGSLSVHGCWGGSHPEGASGVRTCACVGVLLRWASVCVCVRTCALKRGRESEHDRWLGEVGEREQEPLERGEWRPLQASTTPASCIHPLLCRPPAASRGGQEYLWDRFVPPLGEWRTGCT